MGMAEIVRINLKNIHQTVKYTRTSCSKYSAFKKEKKEKKEIAALKWLMPSYKNKMNVKPASNASFCSTHSKGEHHVKYQETKINQQ